MATCECKTRIPTTQTTLYMYLFSFPNSPITHLAITHGSFYSSSLEAKRPSETEQDRLIRGASLGFGEVVEDDASIHTMSTTTTDTTESTSDPVLVRIHSSCLTSETFGSLRCDCSEQLEDSLSQISVASRGIVIYLNQEGRGIGLLDKLK